MAYEIPGFAIGVLPADIDLSNINNRYLAAFIGAAQNVPGTGMGNAALVPYAATGATFIGVLQDTPYQGDAGNVMTSGISMVQVLSDWSIGDILTFDTATGKFKKAGSGDLGIAIAMEDAQAGDISTAHLVRLGKQ